MLTRMAATHNTTSSVHSDSDSDSDSHSDSLDCSIYDPSDCLFCSHSAATSDACLEHMRLAHGFVIPDQAHLAVEAEALVRYLHLVIAEHHECLLCGAARRSPAAARDHMRGKNHCRIDLADPASSEFRDFYEWPAAAAAAAAHDPLAQPVIAGHEMWLASGKTLHHRNHRISKETASEPVVGDDTGDAAEPTARMSAGEKLAMIRREVNDNHVSKREAKMNCLLLTQVGMMRKSDRDVFLSKPAAEQRALLAAFRRDQRLARILASKLARFN